MLAVRPALANLERLTEHADPPWRGDRDGDPLRELGQGPDEDGEPLGA